MDTLTYTLSNDSLSFIPKSFFILRLTDPKEAHPPDSLAISTFLRHRPDPLSLSRHEVVSAVAGDAGHGRRGGPGPYCYQGTTLLNLQTGWTDVDDEFDIRDPSSSTPATTLNCKSTGRDMLLVMAISILMIE